MLQSIYTKPKICKSDKGWYVYFRYNKQLRRYKSGLNYIKNLTEREKEAKALAKVLYHKLKNGWNPFGDVEATNIEMTLTEALDFSLDNLSSI